METITTDSGIVKRYESSEVARTGRRIYHLMFGSWEILRDIEKPKKKGRLKNRATDLPLIPGQICIYKDIIALFNMFDDNPGMKLGDFLEKPPEAPNKIT